MNGTVRNRIELDVLPDRQHNCPKIVTATLLTDRVAYLVGRILSQQRFKLPSNLSEDSTKALVH